jgi:Uma2 family endonuclease
MARQLDETFHVGAAGSLRLTRSTLAEPDILVARQAAIQISPEGFLALAPADILLLVEVSDTTLSFDLGRKALLYARHGVADYWVVDAKTRETHVHRGPGPDGYASVTLIPPNEAAAPLAPDLAPIMRPLATLA